MAGKHENICYQVISDWSRDGRGRLYFMRQGKARALNTDAVIDFGPLKGLNGFPDLFGFEYVGGVPVFAVVEVKTYAYPTLSKDQIQFIDYMVGIGACAYVARESIEGYEIAPWENT